MYPPATTSTSSASPVVKRSWENDDASTTCFQREHVKRSAKQLGRPNYDVILETLAEMADRELDGRGGVQLRRDDDMLSPRNGFVLGSKLRLSP